jgi:hypothetical protein
MGFVIVSEHQFAREAAATLLKLAKTTSDLNLALGFVERAADLKDLIGELPPPAPEAVKGAEDAPDEN